MSRSADKLISQIKKDIADGVLKPGDQLEEAALSERFGVSRTPIREAVKSMVDSGLLETRPRKGAFVRTLSAKELLDLFDVAAELEAMASRVAAEKLRESDIASIKAGLDACYVAADAGDPRAYGQANLDFHHAIHQAAGNYWLTEQLRQIELHINAYRSMPYDVRGRLEKSVQEHQEIFDAILAGDGDKARLLMRDHMMLQGQRLPSILQALEST
ncbi:MAG: GntR family transcriptional regulator [Roseibium sp.]|uniref:GntR family transcriptional regulator n=1 Tax=Roseibium sp. TaxID=1936156 RepID=UPI001B0317AE|nr:GntR family transcriptional regulator [Roseibium sp.]MBO6510737.1 GntR family transcriptional regulator [Roseibium sp.]MBO6893843.1 GntR family transcriptional regulator [Roseibium sp.]MBO6932541.1 GntR family transcriptional regulator [Roseibium sp.]